MAENNKSTKSGTVVGEDLYNQATGSGGGITREIPREGPVPGYVRPLRDPRLVRYDRVAARRDPLVGWEVSKDDRMTAQDAGDKMLELYEVYGLKGQTPAVLEAFHEAIYFAHTMNSGSVLQPGRADITIGGNRMGFDKAVLFLGVDMRRFFRAFADEIRECNLRVMNRAKDSRDIVAQEKAAWLREVAASRGLSRYPQLAHDSSDACWNLTDGERSALEASKAMVFSTSENVADRGRFRAGPSGPTEGGSMFINPTAQGKVLAAR